jgi:hypothetical protein
MTSFFGQFCKTIVNGNHFGRTGLVNADERDWLTCVVNKYTGEDLKAVTQNLSSKNRTRVCYDTKKLI